ncbi:hypothetical protein LZ32DRAFT_94774 [Colletotrichum eremochloae]|nr:hypothetical protein LZ32DRAFT_94774 [Colletotrichum eremochloae]
MQHLTNQTSEGYKFLALRLSRSSTPHLSCNSKRRKGMREESVLGAATELPYMATISSKRATSHESLRSGSKTTRSGRFQQKKANSIRAGDCYAGMQEVLTHTLGGRPRLVETAPPRHSIGFCCALLPTPTSAESMLHRKHTVSFVSMWEWKQLETVGNVRRNRPIPDHTLLHAYIHGHREKGFVAKLGSPSIRVCSLLLVVDRSGSSPTVTVHTHNSLDRCYIVPGRGRAGLL